MASTCLTETFAESFSPRTAAPESDPPLTGRAAKSHWGVLMGGGPTATADWLNRLQNKGGQFIDTVILLAD